MAKVAKEKKPAAKVNKSSKKRASPSKASASKKSKPRRGASESESEESSDDGDESEEYKEESAEGSVAVEEDDEEDGELDVASLDSDDLDGDEEVESGKKKKRKSIGKEPPAKKTKKAKKEDGGKNTREIATLKKVAAPKEDPATSIILPTTMEFLRMLHDNNDRDWFSQHDARYRHALVNWNSFVTALVPIASGVDWTLPYLPAKDLVHRIYRDVRFSKSKVPYKTNMGASLSRTGRKGTFCHYYIHIQPGGGSIVACGKWQPSGPETAAIRQALLNNPKPFRKVINAPEFVKLFGEAKPKKGVQTNVFGHEDELKNSPKVAGVTKDHPDIDLLKLRSVCVQTRLTDEQVLAPDFLKTVESIFKVMCPFVQCVNEMIMPTPPEDDDDDQNGTGAPAGSGSDEEEGEDEEEE